MRRYGWAAATLAVALISAGWLRADGPERTHDIEPEDYFTLDYIQECEASPDGKFVAYTVLGWGGRDEPRSTELWLVDTTTKARTRLTFDPAHDSSPQWSPDGKFVYWTTNRKRPSEDKPPYDGKTQVWRVRVDGGEPFAVTRVEGGIRQYHLSPDGRYVYYTKAGDKSIDGWEELRKTYADIEYGHGVVKYTQLWKLDLESWRAEKLVGETRIIREFAVSPDQRRIAMITTPDAELISHEGWSRVDVWDAATQHVTTPPEQLWRAEAPSPYGWLADLAWSPDARSLAFTVSFDGYPTQIIVADWAAAEPALRRLTRPEGVEVMGRLTWRPGSSDLCFLGDQRARRRVHALNDVRDGRQGEPRVLTPGDVVVSAYSFPLSGRELAFVMSDTKNVGDLYLASAVSSGAFEQLTAVNPQVNTWKLPQISLVTWKGANGDEVEGVLELPPTYQPGGARLPTIVELHGGPTDATRYHLQFWIYGRVLLPAKGYALLSPNYRGSTGYGDKFMTDLIGHENDIEVQDILTGVDALVERGIADPERLGVIGWSNGGLLTNCLITKTQRFKAASSGAGVVDQAMQWGTEDTPGHVINYMQGFPWSVPETYFKGSPLYDLDQVKTPTLIHQGGDDERVPADQSRALYRALKPYVGVPTELLIYPKEGHGLTLYKFREAKMKWDLAWFDQYILGKDGPLPEKPTATAPATAPAPAAAPATAPAP